MHSGLAILAQRAKYPNMGDVGPTYYDLSGLWSLKPEYLGLELLGFQSKIGLRILMLIPAPCKP